MSTRSPQALRLRFRRRRATTRLLPKRANNDHLDTITGGLDGVEQHALFNGGADDDQPQPRHANAELRTCDDGVMVDAGRVADALEQRHRGLHDR